MTAADFPHTMQQQHSLAWLLTQTAPTPTSLQGLCLYDPPVLLPAQTNKQFRCGKRNGLLGRNDQTHQSTPQALTDPTHRRPSSSHKTKPGSVLIGHSDGPPSSTKLPIEHKTFSTDMPAKSGQSILQCWSLVQGPHGQVQVPLKLAMVMKVAPVPATNALRRWWKPLYPLQRG